MRHNAFHTFGGADHYPLRGGTVAAPTERSTMTFAFLRRAATILAGSLTAFAVSTLPAVAAANLPTIDNPGGISAPHSRDGLPTAGDGRMQTTWPAATLVSHFRPGLNPPGANDFTCTSQHRPVVLVPGTIEDAYATWAYYAPMLHKSGYCVFTFNYNPALNLFGGIDEPSEFSGEIRSSAAYLAGFVNRVLDATGADKVDIIGHSQGGGPLPRAYLKWYGGAAHVHQLIGLVPSNQGTTTYGLNRLLLDTDHVVNGSLTDFAAQHNMQSLPEQLVGSDFLTQLNAGTQTEPGVQYTVIASKLDDVVTPYTNAFLSGPGVTNVTVQDVCAGDLTDHFGATYDPVGFQIARNALDPEHAQPVNCTLVPPVIQ